MGVASPLPRISGNLYNCAFNCALPTLLENIEYLHQKEKEGDLPSDNDPVYLNYKKLKDLFARRYGLDPVEAELLTWEQFNGFLLTYPFSAQEILFAPVFRDFIATVESINPIPGMDFLNIDNASLVDGIDSAQGKYLQLDFDTMVRGFYQPFGIKPVLFQSNGSSYESPAHLQAVTSYTLPDSPLSRQAPLPVYLKNAHYELQPHEGIDMQLYFSETALLDGALQDVYVVTTEDVSESRTNRALANLFIEVNRALSGNLLADKSSFERYSTSARDVYAHEERGFFTFAMILLLIDGEQCIEEKKLHAGYLTYLEALLDTNEAKARTLADAIINASCNLTILEQNTDIQELKAEAISIIASNEALLFSDLKEDDSESADVDTTSSILEPTNSGLESAADEEIAGSTDKGHSSEVTSSFELKCMIGLVLVGAALLCTAILVSFALPITVGLCMSGAASLLSSAGLFAYQHFNKEPENLDELQQSKLSP